MTRSILVVDDDPFIRKLIGTTLEDVGGARVVEARDGVEALEMVEQEAPELVLLDVLMPRLDGIEACRLIRAQTRGGDMPIVMLTASDREGDESLAAAAGADRYLRKPFSPLDLLRLVEELPDRHN